MIISLKAFSSSCSGKAGEKVKKSENDYRKKKLNPRRWMSKSELPSLTRSANTSDSTLTSFPTARAFCKRAVVWGTVWFNKNSSEGYKTLIYVLRMDSMSFFLLFCVHELKLFDVILGWNFFVLLAVIEPIFNGTSSDPLSVTKNNSSSGACAKLFSNHFAPSVDNFGAKNAQEMRRKLIARKSMRSFKFCWLTRT